MALAADGATFCTARAEASGHPVLCGLLASHRGMHRYEWLGTVLDDQGRVVGRVEHKAYWSPDRAMRVLEDAIDRGDTR